ncbi:hypothetical protein FBZ90_12639 [Nitrospirillum pindoramense]|uniref:Uncharacterized protein n=1 Tax=Nitrospirillum amazonense TaxID=28077 RepID=A0A560GKT7_9PROT|nr:hypothetical protein FBZ90_12639 [Nitrospirillum amazonense]
MALRFAWAFVEILFSPAVLLIGDLWPCARGLGRKRKGP